MFSEQCFIFLNDKLLCPNEIQIEGQPYYLFKELFLDLKRVNYLFAINKAKFLPSHSIHQRQTYIIIPEMYPTY